METGKERETHSERERASQRERENSLKWNQLIRKQASTSEWTQLNDRQRERERERMEREVMKQNGRRQLNVFQWMTGHDSDLFHRIGIVEKEVGLTTIK